MGGHLFKLTECLAAVEIVGLGVTGEVGPDGRNERAVFKDVKS